MTEKFLEYLDNLKDLINLFERIVLSTELIKDLPLTEEQVYAINAYLSKIQGEWENTFLELLEYGVKWIKHDKGVE